MLDQFSRNLFRGTPQSFACDGMALILAQEAIRSGECERLSREQRGFLYLPFMHSESPLIHQQALALYTELNNGDQLEFELRHKAIIDRFGRYPHRNAILGRTSTPEEEAFYNSLDRVLIVGSSAPGRKKQQAGRRNKRYSARTFISLRHAAISAREITNNLSRRIGGLPFYNLLFYSNKLFQGAKRSKRTTLKAGRGRYAVLPL